MPAQKDYSIYKEMELSIAQIKREMAKTAAAANSRLAQLEKISGVTTSAFVNAKTFFYEHQRSRDRFSRSIKRSDEEIRAEFDAMVDFLTAADSTLTGFRTLTELNRRFDKSKKPIYNDVTGEQLKDVVDFLNSKLFTKNLRKRWDSNQIIDDFLSRLDQHESKEDIMQEYQKFLDSTVTDENEFFGNDFKIKR